MGVSSLIFSPFSDGDTVNAEDLRARFEEIERVLNGGLKKIDLATGTGEKNKIFDTRHIIKPEFYSIANNRIIGTSSDVYYRNRFFSSFNTYVRHEVTGSYNTGDGNFSRSDLLALPAESWTPVDGMAATVLIQGDSDVQAHVTGSFYAHAGGSNDGFNTKLADRRVDTGTSYEGGEPTVLGSGSKANTIQEAAFNRCMACGQFIAAFILYVDKLDGNGPEQQIASLRLLHNRGENSYVFRKQQFSFTSRITLSPGPNKVSYRSIYRMPKETSISFNHVFVDNRNFFVDVHYK